MNIKKILILGSNGFFGKNLKNSLKCSDMNLVYIERKDVDVLDKAKLDYVFNNLSPHIVINCCGLIGSSESNKLLDQFTILNTNLIINTNILDCCDKYNVEKLITFSTYRLFTDVKENYTEEDIHFNRKNDDNIGYLSSKSILDMQIRLLKQKSNIKIVCLFLPNIFGLFDKFCSNARIVPSLIYKMHLANTENVDLFIPSNSNVLVNIIFIDDIVNIIHHSIYHNINTNLLVFNEKSTLNLFQLTQILSKIMNFKNKIHFEESNLYNSNNKIMLPNLSNFEKHFNNFKFTDLSCALHKTIDFFYSTIHFNKENEIPISI